MKTISILIGKMIILAGKIFRRGSVLPGYFSLKIDKNLLHKIELPKKIIAVTGSSGKGSTSSLITEIFRQNGYKVTYNDKGSNLIEGIATSIINDVNLKGVLKSDILVLEVDERYAKHIFKYIKPETLVITNITRDQPPRQGHFDLVCEEINRSITKDITLVLNGDDPYLRKFKTDNIVYYGIHQNKYSYKKNKFMNLNINYCPKCYHKLDYHYYNFENCGDYYCTHCQFKKPKLDYEVTKINYPNNKITINQKIDIKITFNILFCIYNTLAAFSVASIYKVDESSIQKTLDIIHQNNKFYNIYDYKKRIVTVLNNKNENNSTFNQSLLYLERFKELKTIIIGWKEISRRYQFDDISWLYDIDFELLKKQKIHNIICIGINRYDIATRIKLAGIDEKKIKCFETLENGTTYVKEKTKGNIYAILNFDYVEPFNENMNEGDNNDH